MAFKLKIASPGKENVDQEVENVVLKLVSGNVEILENHIPFLSLIKNGYVKYNDQEIEIENGVVHFKNNQLYITYFQ